MENGLKFGHSDRYLLSSNSIYYVIL